MKTCNLVIFILTGCLLCVFAALLVSCTGGKNGGKKADKETIRLYARASDAYIHGHFDETAEILRGVKKFPPALTLRAKAEYFSGDFESAEKSFRGTLKFLPSSAEAKLYLARILRERGDFDGALRLAEALLTDNPLDIRALRLAAELAIESGRNDEAAVFLDKAAELSAESALVLLDRARLRWAAGRGQEALEDLSRARAMLPWDTPLLQSIFNLEKAIMEVM